ncbi:MAG TPA: chromosome partitioning protein ParA [Cyanobacteria bacterium UBA11049]|nr:chromosome partitioning protein ParA [Cyanobacteria bacterium UBA11049]
MSLHPKILVVANGKGGVGKTTTTMSLAGIFSDRYKVLAVDADPQASLSWWMERDRAKMSFDLVKETNPLILGKLRKIEGYELIVVDTPPALDSEALAAVLAAADYLLLPTPPAPMDLTALIQTVRQAVLPVGVAHRVLLTRVDPRSSEEAREAQNTLKEVGIPACKTFIRAYKAHERAALEGVPITQWRGKNSWQAQTDYRKVADEIQQDWR